MISNEPYVLELVSKKAKGMSEELTSWARSQLLLKIGTRVEVTIQLVEDDPIDFKLKKSHEPRWEEPTDKDWEELFVLPWGSRNSARNRVSTEELIKALHKLRENKNRHAGLERQYGGNDYFNSLNQFFKGQGGKFVIGAEGSLWVDRNAD
jgi:hypothetical protein